MSVIKPVLQFGTGFLFLCAVILKQIIMSRVFKVWPKRVKRVNGTVLTPEMVIVVTTKIHVSNPFSNGAQEIKDTYMRIYQFDYKKANCYQTDFNYVALD